MHIYRECTHPYLMIIAAVAAVKFAVFFCFLGHQLPCLNACCSEGVSILLTFLLEKIVFFSLFGCDASPYFILPSFLLFYFSFMHCVLVCVCVSGCFRLNCVLLRFCLIVFRFLNIKIHKRTCKPS